MPRRSASVVGWGLQLDRCASEGHSASALANHCSAAAVKLA